MSAMLEHGGSSKATRGMEGALEPVALREGDLTEVIRTTDVRRQ